jgi:hypothetical protein
VSAAGNHKQKHSSLHRSLHRKQNKLRSLAWWSIRSFLCQTRMCDSWPNLAGPVYPVYPVSNICCLCLCSWGGHGYGGYGGYGNYGGWGNSYGGWGNSWGSGYGGTRATFADVHMHCSTHWPTASICACSQPG